MADDSAMTEMAATVKRLALLLEQKDMIYTSRLDRLVASVDAIARNIDIVSKTLDRICLQLSISVSNSDEGVAFDSLSFPQSLPTVNQSKQQPFEDHSTCLSPPSIGSGYCMLKVIDTVEFIVATENKAISDNILDSVNSSDKANIDTIKEIFTSSWTNATIMSNNTLGDALSGFPIFHICCQKKYSSREQHTLCLLNIDTIVLELQLEMLGLYVHHLTTRLPFFILVFDPGAGRIIFVEGHWDTCKVIRLRLFEGTAAVQPYSHAFSLFHLLRLILNMVEVVAIAFCAILYQCVHAKLLKYKAVQYLELGMGSFQILRIPLPNTKDSICFNSS